MTEITVQKSVVSSQQPGFFRDLTLSPLLFALSFLGAMLFALSLSAEAQQAEKNAADRLSISE